MFSTLFIENLVRMLWPRMCGSIFSECYVLLATPTGPSVCAHWAGCVAIFQFVTGSCSASPGPFAVMAEPCSPCCAWKDSLLFSCFCHASSMSLFCFFIFCISPVVDPASPFHFCRLWKLQCFRWGLSSPVCSSLGPPRPSLGPLLLRTLLLGHTGLFGATQPGQEECSHASDSALVMFRLPGALFWIWTWPASSSHEGSAQSFLFVVVVPDAQSKASGCPGPKPSLACSSSLILCIHISPSHIALFIHTFYF